MKNYIKKTIRRLQFFPTYILNLFYLKIHDTNYKKMPQINGSLQIGGKGAFIFGEGIIINSSVRFNPVGMTNGTALYSLKNAKLEIGNNVGISNSLIYAREKIIIEDGVTIGGGCQILDNDFHSLIYERRKEIPDTDIRSKPIIIKKGAFVGTNSIILKGVSIGERSIVGAGSVVGKDIGDNELWAGNPAKFLKQAN